MYWRRLEGSGGTEGRHIQQILAEKTPVELMKTPRQGCSSPVGAHEQLTHLLPSVSLFLSSLHYSNRCVFFLRLLFFDFFLWHKVTQEP